MAIDASAVTERTKTFKFYKWLTIAFLFGLGMINFADKTIIGFAAVPIMDDLGLTHGQFGLVGSAFFWLFSISALLIGRLSDRIGTKMLLGGMASVWALLQFATVFVFALPQLVITRVILGAAEGPSYNLSIHAAAKWLPQSERGLGFALVNSGSALGPAVAAPVLLYFIFTYGWRSAFILLGAIGVLWTVGWLFLSKETPEDVGLASPEPDRPIAKVSIRWSNLFPLIFSRDFLIVAFLGFASYWGLAVLIVWVPAYLDEVRQLTHGQAQLIEGLPWLVGAIFSILFAYLSDRLFKRTQSSRKSRVYLVGILGILSAIFWYFAVSLPTTAPAVAFMVLAGACTGPIYPLNAAVISDMVMPEHRGTILGVYLAVITTAGLIAPAVSGSLIQAGAHGSGYFAVFTVVAGLSLVASILFLLGVWPPRPGTKPKYIRYQE